MNNIPRTDLRGHVMPADNRTHIERINDWIGSDSYVEGSRRDKGVSEPMPERELYPYRLLSAATDMGGIRRRAGETVYLRPADKGAHHAEIDGVEYPPPSGPLPPGAMWIADHEKAMADLRAQYEEK